MKYSIYIVTLFVTLSAFAQTKDRRAELDIHGSTDEISVSPNEKIFLVTATGNIYYTDNIDSNWHYGKSIFKPSIGLYPDSPHLDRISFFNKDTAIMTGYISAKQNERMGGYYWTKDGGKHWELFDFGGNSWIYNAFVDKNGNAWMGGSSGQIYYSKDFGQHWKKLNSPYNSSSRVNSIFMVSSTSGISGALGNEIYITTNNWKSYKKIKTPYDQKKYSINTDLPEDRIEKIRLWNNVILVNQNRHIYYTDRNKIDWKPFPIKVFDFELDTDSNTLLVVGDSMKIYSFTSPTEFRLQSDARLSGLAYDIKIVNGSLFILSGNNVVYKVQKNELKKLFPYTTDKKIEEPQIVKNGTTLVWGINWNHIYIAEGNEREWYRENVLKFYIKDFRLLNDSAAILWDGRNSHIYSLKDHTSKRYLPEAPLNDFLKSPLVSFTINAGSRGCFHSYYDEVRYNTLNDSTFEAKSVLSSKEEKTVTFENKINKHDLLTVLKDINSNPHDIPSLKDFRITDSEIKNYLTMVDNRLKNKESDIIHRRKKTDRDFYYSVPTMLDTLNNSVLESVLKQTSGFTSTTTNWFDIKIVNKKNDTLIIKREYHEDTFPWYRAWRVEYKGQYFSCYNVSLSRFVNSCIPEGFFGKEEFNNSQLIMAIADNLWSRKE